jgi:hypothetical protein
MNTKIAPALDIVVRREGDYVVIEFIDAVCHCWGQREKCYSTGYIRLTPQEAVRLAEHILHVAQKKLNF